MFNCSDLRPVDYPWLYPLHFLAALDLKYNVQCWPLGLITVMATNDLMVQWLRWYFLLNATWFFCDHSYGWEILKDYWTVLLNRFLNTSYLTVKKDTVQRKELKVIIKKYTHYKEDKSSCQICNCGNIFQGRTSLGVKVLPRTKTQFPWENYIGQIVLVDPEQTVYYLDDWKKFEANMVHNVNGKWQTFVFFQ